MNAGQSITSIAAELERQTESRKDYIAPASKVRAVVVENSLGDSGIQTPNATNQTPSVVKLDGLNGNQYGLTPYAHGQLAQYLDIPKAYYDRTVALEPALAANQINTWLHHRSNDKRLVRTLDGNVRGWLSDRYRPLDNFDLAAHVLPVLRDTGAIVRSAAVTDTRLYIKVTLPTLQREVPGRVGDVIEYGVSISNSEVGNGALNIDDWLLRLLCLNGAKGESVLRRTHLGRGKGRDGEIEDAREYFSTATQRLDDAAFWSKVADVIRGAFRPERLEAIVNKLGNAAARRIESVEIPTVVEVTSEKLGLPSSLNSKILRNLIEGADLTQYGLHNAVTAAANTETDYEVSTILERAGAKVIDLTEKEWSVISKAA